MIKDWELILGILILILQINDALSLTTDKDQKCPPNCLNQKCNTSGECLGCIIGFYGNQCTKICPLSCDKMSGCYQYNGDCIGKCGEGWCGDAKCSTKCNMEGCAATHCERSCQCSQCNLNWWGPQCYSKCDSNKCWSRDGCNQKNGQCTTCLIGLCGSNCQLKCGPGCEIGACSRNSCECSKCKTGWYGSQCQYQCSSSCQESSGCEKDTGRCYQCRSGMCGHSCTKSCGDGCQNGSCDRSCRCYSCKSSICGNECDQVCSTSCAGDTCQRSDCSCNRCPFTKCDKWCTTTCSTNCSNPDQCRLNDCKCTQGCRSGTCGNTCDKECSSACKSNYLMNSNIKNNNNWAALFYQKTTKMVTTTTTKKEKEENKMPICEQQDCGCPGGCIMGYCGIDCRQLCPKNCININNNSSYGLKNDKNNDNNNENTCRQQDCHCLNCKIGTWGPTCDKLCPANMHCQGQEINECNVHTGGCSIPQCKPGWYGNFCNQVCIDPCQLCHINNKSTLICNSDSICNKYDGYCPQEVRCEKWQELPASICEENIYSRRRSCWQNITNDTMTKDEDEDKIIWNNICHCSTCVGPNRLCAEFNPYFINQSWIDTLKNVNETCHHWCSLFLPFAHTIEHNYQYLGCGQYPLPDDSSTTFVIVMIVISSFMLYISVAIYYMCALMFQCHPCKCCQQSNNNDYTPIS